ncbi:condensation domain-containing protein [Mucilaginibacter sp. RCC_168]|uniref:condensation domain-containing protein n=1 Tax=Mucilaginibacter sp. RCC_168 TaxID=3239221 RepID=UPI003524D28B
MKVEELIAELKRSNIHIEVIGDQLKISSNELNIIPMPLIERLKAHKSEIIQFINSSEKFNNYQSIPKILEIKEHYSISHAQKRLLILAQHDNSLMAYNSFAAKVLKGAIHFEFLQQALDILVYRHESLRTIFITIEGEFRQKILDFKEEYSRIEYIDLRYSTMKEREIINKCNSHSKILFNLDKLPLFRACLLQTGEATFLFLFNIHHIISDGWSLKVFFSELMYVYNSLSNSKAVILPTLNIQYKDFTKWQNDQLKDEHFQNKHRSYWHTKLADVEDHAVLMTDYKRPRTLTYNGRLLKKMLPDDASLTTKKLMNCYNVSLFVVLVASLKLLLFKYSNQEDIIIGTSMAGRDHSDLENQVGFYVNSIALRTKVSKNDLYADFIRKVNKTVMEGLEFQAYPFDMLVDEILQFRELNRAPFFDIKIVLQNMEDIQGMRNFQGSEALTDIEIEDFPVESEVCINDLSFRFTADDGKLLLDISFNTDLFTSGRVEQIYEHLVNILRQSTQDPDLEIKEFDYMTKEERQKLMNNYLNL